jgi:hypothetical protein
LPPTAFEKLALEIERPLDQIIGFREPFHSLRSIRSGHNHLVTGSNAFAANLAPHLLAFSFEDPQHVKDGIGRNRIKLQRRHGRRGALSRFLLVA